MTEQGRKTIRDIGSMQGEARKVVEQHGGRIVSAWATLGAFDFIVVVEAPDDATMAKISALVSASLPVETQTLPAIPMDEFIASLK